MDFTYEVLKLFAKNDAREDLFWYEKDGEITFFINCSDLFYWGCADGEDITPETLPILKQAFEDIEAAWPRHGTIWGAQLYCARVRKMRPQGPAYPRDEEAKCLWPLFDACGPEREVGFGNPCEPEGGVYDD